jgi:hypothetical protein
MCFWMLKIDFFRDLVVWLSYDHSQGQYSCIFLGSRFEVLNQFMILGRESCGQLRIMRAAKKYQAAGDFSSFAMTACCSFLFWSNLLVAWCFIALFSLSFSGFSLWC